MSWNILAEISKLCTSRLAVRQKSCCQAEQAVFSRSAAFSIVVVRKMLMLIHVTWFMYANVLQEERHLSGVVLTAPELSQLPFLLKTEAILCLLGCSAGFSEESLDPVKGGSCYQKVVTQLVGRGPKVKS